MRFSNRCLAVMVAAALCAGSAKAGELLDSLKKGTPEVKSAVALAFAPEGILLVGDAKSATVFAIDTGDRPRVPATGEFKVEDIDKAIAKTLNTEPDQILIRDLVVNPLSGVAYLAVHRGRGPDAAAVLLRVDRKGKVEEFALKDVAFSKAVLPNARKGLESITKVGYAKGKVFVAGLSTEQWASMLRSIPFPFTEVDKGASVGIFHGAHGRFETNSPVRTFVPYEIARKAHLVAAYTCTPLV